MIDDQVAGYLLGRPSERVWLHQDQTLWESFDEVAEAAGIDPLGRAWVEIDEQRTDQILVELLQTDLAYGTNLMPEHRARWIAQKFLLSINGYRTRFATNADYSPQMDIRSWTPATEFTFDRGIVAFGPTGSACYWVADEV